MDILKTAVEWARDEVFSSVFFILFGVLFLAGTIGFWQLGKTEIAKAYIVPTLVAGVFLLAVGLGLFFLNKSRPESFTSAYNSDAPTFVQSEITRTEKSMAEYGNIVFKVIPLIIVAAALLVIFVDKPTWRAIGITTIVLSGVVMLVDSNAHARVKTYNEQLVAADQQDGI